MKREESTDGRTDNWPNLVNYWYMLFLIEKGDII